MVANSFTGPDLIKIVATVYPLELGKINPASPNADHQLNKSSKFEAWFVEISSLNVGVS